MNIKNIPRPESMRLYNGTRIIDRHLIDTYPNKYNLSPLLLSSLKVKDWDGLKKHTYKDLKKGDGWWTHSEDLYLDVYSGGGCSFIISFNYNTDDVRFGFLTNNGKSHYSPAEFYRVEYIKSQSEMEIQARAIKWINDMLDNNILTF